MAASLAYPVPGYRTPRAKALGAPQAFKGPLPMKVPAPANDNIPRLPLPANDNIPPLRQGVRRYAPRLARRALSGFRLGPYVGLALLALELYLIYRELYQEQNPIGFFAPGFQLVHNCNKGQPTGHMERGPNWACLALAAGNPYSFGTPPDVVERTAGMMFVRWNQPQHFNSSSTHTFRPVKFQYPVQNETDAMWQHRRPGPQLYPWSPPPQVHPGIDPFSPPGYVEPPPQPLPWRLRPRRRPNIWRDPVEQSDRGPRPARPGPATDPFAPGPTIDIFPKPGTRPGSSRPPSPPRPGEKEKKLHLGIGGVTGRIVSAVTEGADFVSALYDALPEKFRRRQQARRHGKDPKLADKARLLYENFDDISWQAAMENILYEQIEDQVFGRVGKALARARRDSFNKGYRDYLAGLSRVMNTR